jgi:hypothetical protein
MGGFVSKNGFKYYKTGDRGTILNGNLYLKGRNDKQVKRLGQRFELVEVEQEVLRSFPKTKRVIYIHHEGKFLLFNEGKQIEDSSIEEHLTRKFPAYMRPDRIINLEVFPENANGKINVDNPSSDVIDACLTFSGPAGIPNSSISAPFQACLETYTNRTGCDIPHMLLSGRSTNKVPVATQHAMLIADVTQRKAWAQNMMDTEKANVINAINKLQKWDGNNPRISIFSAEGNILLLLLLNVLLLLCSDFFVSTY